MEGKVGVGRRGGGKGGRNEGRRRKKKVSGDQPAQIRFLAQDSLAYGPRCLSAVSPGASQSLSPFLLLRLSSLCCSLFLLLPSLSSFASLTLSLPPLSSFLPLSLCIFPLSRSPFLILSLPPSSLSDSLSLCLPSPLFFLSLLSLAFLLFLSLRFPPFSFPLPSVLP